MVGPRLVGLTRGYRAYVERVRDAASVTGLLEERYRRPTDRGMVQCPFHADANPSCSVTAQFFHCFACGAGGDVFHLVGRLEGLSFVAAVDWLADFYGLQQYRPLSQERALVVGERQVDDATDTAASYYMTRLTPEAVAYLTQARGLPPDLVRTARVGWSDGGLVEALAAVVPLEVLVSAGLAVETKNAPTWAGAPPARDLMRGRVVFPAIVEGRARFLSGRALDPAQEPKYLHQRGRPAPLYNADALRGDTGFVTEGPVDALSLAAWGLPACALLGTAHAGVLSRLQRVPALYLCLDADRAGEKGTLRLAGALGLNRVKVVPLPPGEDPNDFYRTRSRDAFLRLVEAARDPVQHLLDQAPFARLTPAEVDARLNPLYQLLAGVSPTQAERYVNGPIAVWAGGRRSVVKAFEATLASYRQEHRCPACGAILYQG